MQVLCPSVLIYFEQTVPYKEIPIYIGKQTYKTTIKLVFCEKLSVNKINSIIIKCNFLTKNYSWILQK